MIAFVFPGQGSQSVGMGRDLAARYPVCRDTFAEADEALGAPLARLCFEGPEQELQLTVNAQPAILAVSVAALRAVLGEGIRPDIVAGHSLGEYSALVAAGSLAFGDALRLVRKRGAYMQEATPVGVGAMAAIMGLDSISVVDVCRRATTGAEIVTAANLNAPGQTVISGHAAAVDRAVALAQEQGARRAMRLQVSAPFHCALMQPAADRLAADLAATSFSDLQVPLIANTTARPTRSGPESREALVRQVTAPVLWEQSVRTMAELGVRKAIEVGPGKVLSGLMKRIEPDIALATAGDADSIASLRGFIT